LIKENFLGGEEISQYQYEINVDIQNQKFKVTKINFAKTLSCNLKIKLRVIIQKNFKGYRSGAKN
jgi:hypothetical protein